MFTTLLIQPIYNAFVFLVGLMPQGDAGLAIIATVLIMRVVLYPVFTASIRTQMGMAAMQPELDAAAVRYKDDAEALGRERLALLKKHRVNPLSGVLALVVQLALIISLYYALFREGFPHIDTGLLYSFVHAPMMVSTGFFGLLNLLTPHHLILAVLVGATQYAAIALTLNRTPSPAAGGDKAAMMAMQQQMMRYFMPALMAVFSYFFAGAVGLYFLVGNIFSIAQEWLIRRHVL
jgi:YidC/Oxa1 family membrane protein insertase